MGLARIECRTSDRKKNGMIKKQFNTLLDYLTIPNNKSYF